MGIFDSFRIEGYSTQYGDNRTTAHTDLSEAIILVILAMLILAFFLILPGIRGIERLTIFIRVVFSMFVATVIILTNFGMGWSRSEVETRVQYKAGTNKQINASIGMWFGLRGVNVTLKGLPEVQMNEQINYNEHFSWAWSQGKDGFGPLAGVLQKDYHEAQQRGVPYPIIWAIDYLTYDGDGLRFGRFYRIAGWYTHILLWLSLPLWILSNILMFMVIRYGAILMAMCGSSMLLACVVYSCVIDQGMQLVIPYEDGQLVPDFGWCFYITLITGIVCIATALVILFMDLRYPELIATFFGVDALQDYEEFYPDTNDADVPSVEVGASSDNRTTDDHKNGVPGTSSGKTKLQVMPLLRKRSTSIRFQKSRRRVTLLEPQAILTDNPKCDTHTYENVGLKRIDTDNGCEEETMKTCSKEQIV